VTSKLFELPVFRVQVKKDYTEVEKNVQFVISRPTKSQVCVSGERNVRATVLTPCVCAAGQRVGVGHQELLADRRVQLHKADRRDHHAVRSAQPRARQPTVLPPEQHEIVFPRIVPQLFPKSRDENPGSFGRTVGDP